MDSQKLLNVPLYLADTASRKNNPAMPSWFGVVRGSVGVSILPHIGCLSLRSFLKKVDIFRDRENSHHVAHDMFAPPPEAQNWPPEGWRLTRFL